MLLPYQSHWRWKWTEKKNRKSVGKSGTSHKFTHVLCCWVVFSAFDLSNSRQDEWEKKTNDEKNGLVRLKVLRSVSSFILERWITNRFLNQHCSIFRRKGKLINLSNWLQTGEYLKHFIFEKNSSENFSTQKKIGKKREREKKET